MIEYDRKSSDAEARAEDFNIRIFGIGGAGSNVLDRMSEEGMDRSSLVIMNTDARALSSTKAEGKVQLGRSLTMGLGCGGDPELGREAALEVENEIREAVRGCGMVFLCAGLGGGTGSGATPIVARIAREEGCFVVVFATLPFHFEGRRRIQQANVALSELRESANALLTFENDRMGELIVPVDGVDKAFTAADQTICQSVRAISNLVEQPGMIRIGMDDLLAVLRGRNARCLFGFGRATGKKRTELALEQALDNPLLDRGQLLEHTSNVLAQISGGPDMTLAEVENVMRVLSSHVDEETQILFGVSTNPNLGDSLCVTIISSLDRESTARPAASVHTSGRTAPPRPVREERASAPAPAPMPSRPVEPEIEPEPEHWQEEEEPASPVARDEYEEDYADDVEQMMEPEPVHKAPQAQVKPVQFIPVEPRRQVEEVAPEEPAADYEDEESEPALSAQDDYVEDEPEVEEEPPRRPAINFEPDAREDSEYESRENALREQRELERERQREHARTFKFQRDPDYAEPEREAPLRKPIQFDERDEQGGSGPAGKHAQPETKPAPPVPSPVPAPVPAPQSTGIQRGQIHSIFQVVDSPKQNAPGNNAPRPKVKIEFSADDSVDEPRTITLEQPRPSRATREDEEFAAAHATGRGVDRRAPRERERTPFAQEDETEEEASGGMGGVLGFMETAAHGAEPVPAGVGAAAIEARRRKMEAGQQMLNLDPPARGRFDKGEPTILDGEDLDIPTYLRKRKRVR